MFEKRQTNDKFLTGNELREEELLSIRAMMNSEKLHSRWMFHERGYGSGPCCRRDIRDPFGHEKTR